MPDTSLQTVTPGSAALSAENYQTFEMAKENDDVLGGDNIAQIRSYSAYARAQAQAIHKTIAATSGIEDVAAIKQEALETEQTFAKVGLYADQRIGELLRNLEQAKRGPKVNSPEGEKTKTETIKESGMSTKTAYQLEQLAANPDVVQAVLDKAEQDGTIPSRAQVLRAIKERDQAREEAEQYSSELEDAQAEIRALEKQNDQLFEKASAATEPQVVERRVEVPSEADRRRIGDLEHERDVYLADVQKLRKRNEEMRKELEQAKVLLGDQDHTDNARWDVSAFTAATNNYLRQYGGKVWAFDQFYRVDDVTQQEFIKAITSLAAFSQNLAQIVLEINGNEE